MQKWRERKKQLLSGAAMLVVTVPLLLYALSVGSVDPSLAYEGVEMTMREDGSVQMLFEVSVRDLEEARGDTIKLVGARFKMNYDPEYLTPSDHQTNQPLDPGDDPYRAFQYSPDLYKVEKDTVMIPQDPFVHQPIGKEFSQILPGQIGLTLAANLKREALGPNAQGLIPIQVGENDWRCYIDQTGKDGKVALGTLSFRVDREDLDKLPEISRLFEGILKEQDPQAKDGSGKYLIHYKDMTQPLLLSEGDWAIEVYAPAWTPGLGAGRGYALGYLDNSRVAANESSASYMYGYYPYAISHFTFHFPRIPIAVEAVESELTIDAYQAYRDGRVSDVDNALQKYSPMVKVRYSDGSQENVTFPWGRVTAPWATTKVTNWGDNATWDEAWEATTGIVGGDIEYDCRQGDYKVQKCYCYQDDKGDQLRFPLPVNVHLTVTPITLVDVTANDLERSYVLNNDLVSTGGVQTLGDLDLPEEARLITDVPAGGATLTMSIPGWSHENAVAAVPPEYWPFGNMEIKDLQKDGATDSQFHRWPVYDDLSNQGGDGWATVENGAAMGKNRAGAYTFKMAGTYGGAPVAGFARAEIQAAYPWLTVPKDNYPLPDALRRIVWNGSTEEGDKKLEDQNRYTVTYVETTTELEDDPSTAKVEENLELLPNMTLRVVKRGEGGGLMDLPETAVFRLKLPDGTEMGIGTVGGVTLEDWFAQTSEDSASYQSARTDLTGEGGSQVKAFDLTTNPGKTDRGGYQSERERLLRYINLGGWFSVAVNEDPARYLWTDFIPVYVEPRENHHLESKTYNFIGENADLYHFVKQQDGSFPTTVHLPPGEYETVDETGKPANDPVTEKDEVTGMDVVVGYVRHVERYGLKTLYSGITGGQFGELNTFTVTSPWSVTPEAITTPATTAITRYGPNSFLNNALYGAYGQVKNPGLGLKTGIDGGKKYESMEHTGTIRVQRELQDPQLEKITLTYEGLQTGGITYGPDGNVDLVTYSTRTEGYTVRQEYTLTITNVGTVDIQGLAIDTLTDIDGDGGHFVLLKPPASFLPAGASTTFTLSYEYDLRANANGGELEYLDKLFITSDSRKTVGPGTTEGTDYLLNFDAQFKVTGSKIHRVWVEYNPEDGTMGTAQVIVGEENGVINPNAGSSAATKDMVVYVMATPTDEYEVENYVARDSTGGPVILTPYVGPVTLPDGTTVNVSATSQIRIWSFTMPDYDVTVTIDFYEPIRSKLRLSELTTYADKDRNNLYITDPPTPGPNPGRVNYEYKVWQKTFTKAETDAAAAYQPTPGVNATEEQQGRYLMQGGTATKKGYSDQVDQYLVVIPYEADYSQVEATLRKVVYTNNGKNLDLSPITVEMTLYPTDPLINTNRSQIYQTNNGNTATPTVHTSQAFDSPTPGTSSYVVIRINYRDTDNNVEENRYYYVEIHRTPREPVAELNYGNSPYGMIMNAKNIDDADRQKAKEAFKDNRYSFSGLEPALVPEKAMEEKLEQIHYWTEAWVAPDAAYEPESRMGLDLYDETKNLDLNDYSFFAVIGEDFLDPGLRKVLDSSGRPADTTRAVLSLEVYILDLDATTQLGRFGLPADPADPALDPADQAALAARTILLSRQTPANTLVRDWSSLSPEHTDGRYLRPGRYQLVYTLPDFDYDDYYATPEAERDPDRDPTLKVTRDFVVLAPVGDVNADMPSGQPGAWDHVSDHTDHLLVKGRVTAPLGYMTDYYPDGAIFKLRTCDVNNDRNINNIDANAIRVEDGAKVERYYHPVNYK